MAMGDLPLFSMLKTRMHWHQTRQKLLAENVANADLPAFKPRDLREVDFGRALGAAISRVTLTTTSPSHLSALGGGASTDSANARRFETTPSGNSVNLEDEMLKVAQNQATSSSPHRSTRAAWRCSRQPSASADEGVGHGFPAQHRHRRLGIENAGRANAHHRRERRQRGLTGDRPGLRPIAARS